VEGQVAIQINFRFLTSSVFSLLLFTLSGCLTVNEKLASSRPSVVNGNSKNEVISSVGHPSDTQFNGGIEVWRYCTTGLFSDDYLTVVFRDGKVIGKETYKNTRGGDCTSFFRPIYWSNYLPKKPTNRRSSKNKDNNKSNSISTGTGFFINQNGYLVTNHHVVKSCDKISVKGFGTARKIASDKINDIAILKVEHGPSSFALIRGRQKVSLGETVVVYGFPYAGALSQDGNLTQGNISALSGFGNDIRMFQISAPVQPGNSGGPLLDSSKNVIGIVTAKLNAVAIANITGDIPQNVNFALKNDILKSVLEINGIDYQQSDHQQKYDLVEIAKGAKKFTSLVICE